MAAALAASSLALGAVVQPAPAGAIGGSAATGSRPATAIVPGAAPATHQAGLLRTACSFAIFVGTLGYGTRFNYATCLSANPQGEPPLRPAFARGAGLGV